MGVHPRRIAIPLLLLAWFTLISSTPAMAATTLSAEIVSWQVIGLDSNQPASSEPELYLVQAQVTNSGGETATGVDATLSLGAPTPTDCGGGPCVFLVSPATYSIGSIAPGAKADAFWTVRVVKTAAAEGTETPITVSVTAANAPAVAATQLPRTGLCSPDTAGGILRVEGLVSQNRNHVLSYAVSPGIQLPDGSWEVVLGSSFTVTVIAHTATDYNEISVPAIVDPSGNLTPIATSFDYENGATDDDIYTLEAGGNVTAEYVYRAAGIGDVSLSQLIYDCSGSSYHYNSDYRVNSVTIHVVGAPSQPSMSLTKQVSPSGTVSPGDRVTFTITYTNTGLAPATNFVITDVVDPSLNDPVVSSGGIFDPATRTITWNLGTVAGLSSGSVTFTATVDDFAGGRTIRNAATGDADQFNPITTALITSSVRQTTPVTGAHSALLAILGLASIGFGIALSDRKLEPVYR